MSLLVRCSFAAFGGSCAPDDEEAWFETENESQTIVTLSCFPDLSSDAPVKRTILKRSETGIGLGLGLGLLS